MTDLVRPFEEALRDRYRILRELGRGGMAFVLLAKDLKHDRPVAIKVLHPEVAATLGSERFMREIGIAARLSHPHIVPLHDSGEAGGLLYYVMPYVEGETLRDRLDREKQLPLDEALRLAGEVADALAHAHAHGILHRDIKPENILLEAGHAVVADFGIARALGPATGDGLTRTGLAVGTPAYMSPEQAGGAGNVDARTDVYALAAVLYEILAGEPPHTGPTPEAILARKLSGELRSLAPVRSVPLALDDVFRKALAPSPADRYATPAEFVEAAKRAAEGRRLATRGRRRIWMAVAALLLVASAATGWWLARPGPSRADTVAVLPFANVGGDPATQVFVDGLFEVVTSKLTQLEQYFDRPVWVVPASEIRGRTVSSAEQARREFGATLAITGSVQQLGESLRLTLNLVDAPTLRQVRSALVQGALTDLGVWQDGVVVRLADMLRLEMGPRARLTIAAGGTASPEAYELYVQARGRLQEAHADAPREAAELFRRALEYDDGYALTHAGLADAYWTLYGETGDTAWVSHAVASSRRAVELDDSLAPVWVALGRIHVGTARFDDAIRALDRALSIDPLNGEAFRILATAYTRLGRHDEAEATLLRAIGVRRNDWRAYTSLGTFYYEQGRYEEAAAQFVRVAEYNPLDPWAYVNAGAMYFLLDQWVEARRMFERGLRIEPVAALHSNLGTLDFYEGRYAESARNFESAIELQPDHYLFWRNLADALHRVPGEREQSRAAYRRAIELGEGAAAVNPADARVLASLAISHATLGEHAAAERWLVRLLDVMAEDPNRTYNAAMVYELLGDRDAALHWLGRALAGGFSRRIVDSSPELNALRADPRYEDIALKP